MNDDRPILSVILMEIRRHGPKDVTCTQRFNWTYFFSWRSSGCCRSTTALDRWSSCCSRWWADTRLSRSLTLNPNSSWRPYKTTTLVFASIIYLSTFIAPCQSNSIGGSKGGGSRNGPQHSEKTPKVTLDISKTHYLPCNNIQIVIS